MYQTILVPVDGSATSTRGLDEAIRIGALAGSRICLVHMLDQALYASGFESYALYTQDLLPHLRRRGESLLEEARQRVERAGLACESDLVEGVGQHLVDVVLEKIKSRSVDLVVIGTHGRRGVNRFMLGSDAEQVLRSSPVPVLLVRAPDGTAQPAATTTADACESTVPA